MTIPAKDLLVTGGSLAGWWTAVFLKVNVANVNVTVLNTRMDSVLAETTEPAFYEYLQLIGLTQQHIIKYADGNFRSAQAYLNWKHPQHQYFHTEEELDFTYDAIDFNQWMLKLRKAGYGQNINDYSVFAQAAKSGRAAIDAQSGIKAGLNFDARELEKVLISYALELGINKIDDEVLSVILDSDNNIDAVITVDHGSIKSDFYFDATGVQARLIGQSMGVEYECWSAYLPFNHRKIVAAPPQGSRLIPFSSVQWVEQGWIKSIPLTNKVVCEYVYNSAIHENSQLDDFFADSISIDFEPGMRKKIWHKNCLAIGESGVSLDNFNYSSFYLAVLTLARFVEYWPSLQLYDALEQEFNRIMYVDYKSIRDFHCLHYALIKMQNRSLNVLSHFELPPSLQYRLDLYKNCGRSLADENTLLHPTQWLNFLMGMDIWPDHYDCIASHHADDIYMQYAQREKNKVDNIVKKLPDYDSYIKRYMA